ncbi:MAG: tetratricopeptide repeat protein [Pseudomonadota bacterium]|nr:tetratricopeptide repeat protein [Pseudomonadota bacterium]
MRHDLWGNPVTAANDRAREALDGIVSSYLGFRLDTGDYLKAAFEADPEMPLALAWRGCFWLLFCTPSMTKRALKDRDAAKAIMDRGGCNRREALHIEALDQWCHGSWEGAIRAWETILLEWPRDPMALRLAHYAHFYVAGGDAMRRSSGRVLWAWDETVPGHGYVQAIHGFGCEEAGDYPTAERYCRRAVELNPADIWGVHAMAHVMEMQGRHHEGLGWIDANAGAWDGVTNYFRYHVWWHKALFALELGRHDQVLDLYDTRIRGEQTDEYLDITNGAAMLWRLEQDGVNVGDRWTELAEKSAGRARDHQLCFAEVHYAMALAAAGRADDIEVLVADMATPSSNSESTQDNVRSAVGIAVVNGVAAARSGAHDRAVALLAPVRDRFRLLGGSHAQRDIFERILLESAIANGNLLLARALVSERVTLKPSSPYTLRRQADVLAMAGQPEAAARARMEAARLAA